MGSTTPADLTFDYPASLQEYMVSEQDYLQQHPEYARLCTGIVVYDKAGKMLLVQRAKTEKAFPGMWASHQIHTS
jgi:isopentenyldiphosphate isomerase